VNLFKERIESRADWGGVFRSVQAFSPLVEYILNKENLPSEKIETLTPGTNAVFRSGEYVIKIFAPSESGLDQTDDLKTELFALKRANETGVAAPKLVASGVVEDKYRFAYMITEYIEGAEFSEAVKSMSGEEKIAAARRLRTATDKMNTPCKPFNGIDVINDKGRYRRWDKRYSDKFKAERLEYIKSRNFGEKVFCHGDLCGDNILLTPQGELCIIDFADAVLAPPVYEHALVAIELFELDPALLRGYFGGISAGELTKICFDGLLLHDFGGDIVAEHIGKPADFLNLKALRNRLERKIELALRSHTDA
jgi:aminoglycoside phosphotransferase